MLLIYFYLVLLISCNICEYEDIDNCVSCGSNEKSDQCQLCEDKYFPFLNNLLCLPCDHYHVGNIGCGGKCDSSKYEQTRNIMCEEDGCKEGYYNIEGICFPCSVGDDFCSKCTYKPDTKITYGPIITADVTDKKYYKCQECISNKYKINEYGRCEHCMIPFCSDCYYNSFTDISPICNKCYYGYYLNKEGTCSKCHCPVEIQNGYCMVCSENKNDFSNAECFCDDNYVFIPKANCSECPEYCSKCRYENQKKICYQCYLGYYLNSNNECISCGESDENTNFVCKKYNSNSYIPCPEHCFSCFSKNGEIMYIHIWIK